MSDSVRPAPETSPIEIGSINLTADDEAPTPDRSRKRSKVRTITLYALLAAALAGAGTLGWTGWQIGTQKDATLSTPDTIGTLKLDASEDGQETADYLQTALAAEINLDAAVGAVYSDGTKNVLFLGGTGLLWTPEKNLDSAFTLVDDAQGSVTDIRKVDAGPLGGTMKCGTTKSDEGALAVCGWSDHGAVALAMFPDRTPAEAEPLMREIRVATQKRN